jgi:hypothetical protein
MSICSKKDVREVIPPVVPTDISNLITDYVCPEIKNAAEKLYDEVVYEIINLEFCPKEFFVEKMVKKFIENVGSSFQDFLKKNDKLLKDQGFEAINIISDEISGTFLPKRILNMHDTFDVTYPFHEFVYKTLEKLGKKEGYVGEDDSLDEYTDSLYIRKPPMPKLCNGKKVAAKKS